jgi:hypothetical protein
MADNIDVRQAEIERVQAAVKAIVKLMNGSFELDESKLQALTSYKNIQSDISTIKPSAQAGK